MAVSLTWSALPVMEVKADYESPYAALIPTNDDTAEQVAAKKVTFNNVDWYIIADDSTAVDAGTVTLFAKDVILESEFDD